MIELLGDQHEPLRMKAVPFVSDENTPYVAFSHVWADGLGNQQAFALPPCQVQRVQRLVQGINGRKFVRGVEGEEVALLEDRRLYLWCDSLLCPVIEQLPSNLDTESAERRQVLREHRE